MEYGSQFQLFGSQHMIVLLSLSLLILGMAWGAKQLRAAGKKRLGWLSGFLLLAFALAVYLQQALYGGLSPAYSLPMELCDWVLVACLVTLFRPNTLASEVACYWGFAGTLQAMLTPDISQGFPSWQFVAFFWGHGAVLLAIVYIIVAQRFRPRRGSVSRMMIALNLYGLTALSLDLAFGWNYGYLLYKPSQPSLFDFLGSWPWYLVSIEAIALANFCLLDLLGKLLAKGDVQNLIVKG